MTYRMRIAEERDAGAIVALAEQAGMGTLSTIDGSLVAEEYDRILGFVRISIIDGIAYVNPVVVSPDAQRTGVGHALMEAARDEHGELRFVARGGALPFYEALGCERIGWGEIAEAIASDCPTCNDLESCGPVPMRYR